MDARRFATVLAVPCALCAAGSAAAQDRNLRDTREMRMRIVPNAHQDDRLPDAGPVPRRAGSATIESWDVDDDIAVSLGRFRVVDRARQWGRLDRERAPLQMEVETRPIAGAGFRMRF